MKVKLNRKNIKALLQSEMMMKAVKNAAQSQGEEQSSFVGFDRVQVIVKKEK